MWKPLSLGRVIAVRVYTFQNHPDFYFPKACLLLPDIKEKNPAIVPFSLNNTYLYAA
jgi:hypothetical protein